MSNLWILRSFGNGGRYPVSYSKRTCLLWGRQCLQMTRLISGKGMSCEFADTQVDINKLICKTVQELFTHNPHICGHLSGWPIIF